MIRFRTLGLALVAVFAMSAVVASAASAIKPQFLNKAGVVVPAFKCEEKPGGYGEYSTQAACEKNPGGVETTGGKWKRFDVLFSSAGGAGKLVTKEGHEVACSSVANERILLNGKEDQATIRFKGCKAFGLLPCKTTGAGAEEIVSKVSSLLVYTNSTSVPVQVALLLKPNSPPIFAKFTCEGFGLKETIAVEGSVLAPITVVNQKTKTFTLTLKETGGVAEPTEYEEKAGEVPKKKASLISTGTEFETFGPEASGIMSTDTITLLPAGEEGTIEA
jgi:hypothetical protein